MGDLIHQLLDIFLHLDSNLNMWAGVLGAWLYALLFLILFCETGLVVTPFLPGDSLLFAVGMLAATDGSPLSLPLIVVLLCLAAIAGDAANYSIGLRVGPQVFSREDSRWLNRHHLQRAHEFYERHGGKTIILARFMPIIRTFAPFVAGIGRMGYPRFAAFNVVGGVAWVSSFLLGGYYFGNIPVVKRNFHFVIVAIIIVSVMPGMIEYLRSRRARPAPSTAPAAE
jgi:membrane-associated protein